MVDQTRQLRSFCFCGNTEDLCRLQWQLKNTQNVDHLQDRASGDMTSEAAARSQRMRLGWGTSCMEELWGKVQKLLEVRSVLQQEALHKPNQGQWWTRTNFTAFSDSVKPVYRVSPPGELPCVLMPWQPRCNCTSLQFIREHTNSAQPTMLGINPTGGFYKRRIPGSAFKVTGSLNRKKEKKGNPCTL